MVNINYLQISFMIQGKQNIQNDSLSYLTNTVLMIRPFNFRANQMTKSTNYYQNSSLSQNTLSIKEQSLIQFDGFTNLLQKEGLNVIVVQDEGVNDTPDSVFPNNWVSFHLKYKYILYPMLAPNRRLQRQIDIFSCLLQKGIKVQLLNDYSSFESSNTILQGTGSMVLDRQYRVAYAALSPRTTKNMFLKFCSDQGYKPYYFQANQTVNGNRLPIYHTNVMMWIGEGVACICLDSIDNLQQKQQVLLSLQSTKRQLILINQQQVANFCGNSLMVKNKEGDKLFIMSKRAYNNYTTQQKDLISKFGKIIYFDLETIENNGGGSARCMLAEIF